MSVVIIRELPIDPMEGTWHYYVNGDPTAGFSATQGSLSTRVDQGSKHGVIYKKTGPNDTDWSEAITGGTGSASTATTTVAGISRVDNNGAGDPQALTTTGHLLDADPHPQYALDTEKGAASGIATLDGSAKLTSAQLPLGTSASTACAGNDARLSDARAPTAHASSHSSGGSDPITLAESQVTNLVTDLAGKVSTSDSRLSDARTPTAHHASHQNGGTDEIATATAGANAIPKAGAGGTLAIGWIPTGSSSSTVCIGNDSRLSDSRTPTAHASTHSSGSTDPVTVTNLAGYPGGTSTFLRADGTFAAPGGGSDPWTYLVLASDFTTTSATAVDVTGMGFAPSANTKYEFYGFLMLRTATTTVNPRLGLAWPTGGTDGVAMIYESQAATSAPINANGNINAALLIPAGGLPNTTQSWPVGVEGMFLAGTSPSGNVRLQLASETSGTTVTIKAGSFLRYRTFS